jgi:hypothetical protein
VRPGVLCKVSAALSGSPIAGYSGLMPLSGSPRWTYDAAHPGVREGAVRDVGRVCIGTPFKPMRCRTLAQPYLLPWLFARVRSPLSHARAGTRWRLR